MSSEAFEGIVDGLHPLPFPQVRRLSLLDLLLGTLVSSSVSMNSITETKLQNYLLMTPSNYSNRFERKKNREIKFILRV